MVYAGPTGRPKYTYIPTGMLRPHCSMYLLKVRLKVHILNKISFNLIIQTRASIKPYMLFNPNSDSVIMTVRKVNKTENKECSVKVVIKRKESAVAVTAGGEV